MSETKKPAFPQTPDGVTDWELVFEGPDGLIALISQVRTVAALRECSLVVIGQLFTRKQDQLEVARLTHQLDSLLAGPDGSQDISQLSVTISGLLRQIKSERLQKAQDYLANKPRKRRRNRRSQPVGKRLSNTIYRLINDPIFSISVGGIVFVLLMGVLGIVINIYTDGKLVEALGIGESGQPEPQVEQVKQSGTPDATEPEKSEQLVADPVPPARSVIKDKAPEMPPALVLARMFLPRVSDDSGKGFGQVLPILVLTDRRELSNVCRLKPVILDMLNAQFGKFQGRKKNLTDQALKSVGFEVMNLLNARLGKSAVARVLLVRGADHRDRAELLCNLAPEKFLKYLASD